MAEIPLTCTVGIPNSLRFFNQEGWHCATFDLPRSRTMQAERHSQFAGGLFNRKTVVAQPASKVVSVPAISSVFFVLVKSAFGEFRLVAVRSWYRQLY